jgi:hypothetical protein
MREAGRVTRGEDERECQMERREGREAETESGGVGQDCGRGTMYLQAGKGVFFDSVSLGRVPEMHELSTSTRSRWIDFMDHLWVQPL